MGMIYTVPVKNIATRLNGDNIPAIVRPIEGGAAVVVNLENGERISAICSPSFNPLEMIVILGEPIPRVTSRSSYLRPFCTYTTFNESLSNTLMVGTTIVSGICLM